MVDLLRNIFIQICIEKDEDDVCWSPWKINHSVEVENLLIYVGYYRCWVLICSWHCYYHTRRKTQGVKPFFDRLVFNLCLSIKIRNRTEARVDARLNPWVPFYFRWSLHLLSLCLGIEKSRKQFEYFRQLKHDAG